VRYESKEAIDRRDSVPRGSGSSRPCAEPLKDAPGDGEAEGGVAGRTGPELSFGSGKGRVVRIDESGGADEVGWDGWRITVVLYSEPEEERLLCKSGSLPIFANIKLTLLMENE
jgi:hypothetical protein